MDYSNFFSLVDPNIKKKRLMPLKGPSETNKATQNTPSPTTGNVARGALSRNNNTGNEEGNYLGIPTKNLKLAHGLASLSYAVDPKGAGGALMEGTSALLRENARIGEKAREVMREEQMEAERRRQEIEDRELKYDRDLEAEKRERGYTLGDKAEQNKEYDRRFSLEQKAKEDYDIRSGERGYRSALRERALRDSQSEFDLFRNARQNKINPKTNKSYTDDEIVTDYRSLGGSGKEKSKIDEKTVFKNAEAELKSLGAEVDMDGGMIDFPAGNEAAISRALKKHGINFYPERTQGTPGRKAYYIGAYSSDQSAAQPTFNLEDYMPGKVGK